MDKTFKLQYRSLGLNIAFYRKKSGYTQIQMAELLEIDRSHMSAIELGNVGVSLDVLFRFCQLLAITPSQLFDFR